MGGVFYSVVADRRQPNPYMHIFRYLVYFREVGGRGGGGLHFDPRFVGAPGAGAVPVACGRRGIAGGEGGEKKMFPLTPPPKQYLVCFVIRGVFLFLEGGAYSLVACISHLIVWAAGVFIGMHGRSNMTIDPRTPTAIAGVPLHDNIIAVVSSRNI